MQIVRVDLESGALRSFNLDLHRDWPVDTPAPTVRLNVVREAYATSLNVADLADNR